MPPLYSPFAPPIFPAQQPPTNPLLAGRQPASSYNTPLSPLDEFAYRQWVQQNNVPTNPNATTPQDYDMRGFYQGLQQQNPKAQSAINPNDNRLHFPDFWKVPTHEHFSNESQWASPTSPQWVGDNQLANPNGQVIYNDRPQGGGLLGLLGMLPK